MLPLPLPGTRFARKGGRGRQSRIFRATSYDTMTAATECRLRKKKIKVDRWFFFVWRQDDDDGDEEG